MSSERRACEVLDCDKDAITEHFDGAQLGVWLCEEHGDLLGFMDLQLKPRCRPVGDD